MKHFLKEWGVFLLIMAAFLMARLVIFDLVTVDGHSMDPTLADREKLFLLKQTTIERYDIVVAEEKDAQGTKKIVKRVVGMPGDQLAFKDDKLYINGQETAEPYLKDYLQAFHNDKLQKTYAYNNYFQNIAQNSPAFTVDNSGNSQFRVTVPKGEYYLLGDDRLISKDSRAVGSFKKESIVGEVKGRYWPLNAIGSIE